MSVVQPPAQTIAHFRNLFISITNSLENGLEKMTRNEGIYSLPPQMPLKESDRESIQVHVLLI